MNCNYPGSLGYCLHSLPPSQKSPALCTFHHHRYTQRSLPLNCCNLYPIFLSEDLNDQELGTEDKGLKNMKVDTHVYCNSLVGISQNPSLLSHPRQNSEPGLGTMGTYSLVPFPLNSVGSVSHRTLWALCMSLPSLLSSYSLLVYSLELHFCGSSLPVSQVYVHTALYSLHLSTLYLVQWWWVYLFCSLPSKCMAQDSNVTYVWEVATKTRTLSNFRALQDLKILLQSLRGICTELQRGNITAQIGRD